MDNYKILEQLIKFNTIKDNENTEILNYIEQYLKKNNFETEYKNKYLIMSIGNNPQLGFLGHTDTVEYIDGWKTDPFKLTKKNNNLYGLGACDMKGGIAAIMDAISKVNFNKLKYGMKVYITYDEEIGFNGINDIVKLNQEFPEIMIFGEPTNNEILIGSKGLLEIELQFKGIKAHSSTPDKGKSANLNAVKFINELDNWYKGNIKNQENKNFEVPYTTMNVGLINGGSAKNSISANCNVFIDFRLSDEKHINKNIAKIKALSNKYECKVKVVEEIKPFINEFKWIKEIKTANFITEASLVNCKNKIILGTGPVTAHEVNEYITEDSYNKLVEQYKELIERICIKEQNNEVALFSMTEM